MIEVAGIDQHRNKKHLQCTMPVKLMSKWLLSCGELIGSASQPIWALVANFVTLHLLPHLNALTQLPCENILLISSKLDDIMVWDCAQCALVLFNNRYDSSKV